MVRLLLTLIIPIKAVWVDLIFHTASALWLNCHKINNDKVSYIRAACSPWVCVGSLQVLCFLPQYKNMQLVE